MPMQNNEPTFQPYQPSSFEQKKLLLEHRYPLNLRLTKWVSVGLDPMNNFHPIITLTNVAMMGVKFSIAEWSEFILLENNILSFLKCESSFNNFYQHNMINHKICTRSTEHVKMISIKSNNYEVFLDLQSCEKLFVTLKDIISQYIQLLYSLNFLTVYNEMLLDVITHEGEFFTNIKKLIKKDSISHFALRESLELYPDIILRDISLIYIN